jgi:hypothetical protein
MKCEFEIADLITTLVSIATIDRLLQLLLLLGKGKFIPVDN